jgi:hypothetical protein
MLLSAQKCSEGFLLPTGDNKMANLLYKIECQARESRMWFYVRFCEPKLYRYAKGFEFEKIEERCRRYPRAAAREARFRHEYAMQQTALHRVLEPAFLLGEADWTEDDDGSMVELRHRAAAALLEANPDAALVPCVSGTTPAMMVCLDPHGSLDDLDMLLTARPKCALQTDSQGRVPLHYACINNRANLPMIKMLLDACPDAAAVQDNFGRVPLHYAAMASPSFSGHANVEQTISDQSGKAGICTEDIMELIIGANKEAVEVTDKKGMIPLDHLCRHIDSCSSDAEREQLKALGRILRQCSSDGKLVLPEAETARC